MTIIRKSKMIGNVLIKQTKKKDSQKQDFLTEDQFNRLYKDLTFNQINLVRYKEQRNEMIV